MKTTLKHTLAVTFVFIGGELSPVSHSWVLVSFNKPPSLSVSMIYKYYKKHVKLNYLTNESIYKICNESVQGNKLPKLTHLIESLKLDRNSSKLDIMSLLHLLYLLRSVVGELANIIITRTSEISSP